MSYYLHMDGVDDYIRTPSVTIDAVEIDFELLARRAWGIYVHLVIANGHFRINGSNRDEWLAHWAQGYVNGQPVANNTAFIPLGERSMVRLQSDVAANANLYLLSNELGGGNINANVYGIKLFSGTELIAHYDMSTGTVDDQTGNGHHATLIGGTWVQTGEDVTYSVATRQAYFADVSLQAATEQILYVDVSYQLATKQLLHSDVVQQVETRQEMYVDVTQQLPTEQRVYAGVLIDVPALQQYYADLVWEYPTLQRYYDPDANEYVRELHVDVTITQQLSVAIPITRSLDWTVRI